MVALLIYLDGHKIALNAMLACLIHELGHLFIIRMFGGRVRMVNLTAVGAEINPEYRKPLPYRKELITAVAGPLANILFAVASAGVGQYLFTGFNLCFGLLNLLPIHALDGGRILACCLNVHCFFVAESICRFISTLFSGIMLGLGFAAWRVLGNLTLLVTAIWLVVNTLKN